MRMMRLVCCVMLCAAAVTAEAQLKVTAVRRLEAGDEYRWTSPRFSPDGRLVYYSRDGYRGIWELRLDGGRRRITDDRGAGYGFMLSPDGSRIAYRRTLIDKQHYRRTQEIVVHDLATNVETRVASGRNLSIPAFSRQGVVYSSGKRTANLDATAADPVLLGIEVTRIAVAARGVKQLLDPLGMGQYIWPSLSPESTRILAVEMERGAFVCDLQGNVQVRLGRRNAPAWSRDGRWIVYMDDRDDGYNVTSSDLFAVSADGARTVRLTDTEQVREMYPDCSAVDNAIVCSSLEGALFLLTYEEE